MLPAVIRSPVGDGEKPHLLRHHPGGESPGVLLDEVGKRPLVAAQRGPMDDVGQGFFAGFVVVSLRQLPKCISVFLESQFENAGASAAQAILRIQFLFRRMQKLDIGAMRIMATELAQGVGIRVF